LIFNISINTPKVKKIVFPLVEDNLLVENLSGLGNLDLPQL